MPPEPPTSPDSKQKASPDYPGLVHLLIEPLLEAPESLHVYCEQTNQNQKVWLRVAFEGEEKGRVFGRGGRNIQAVRNVINCAAKLVSQSVYLDIYGSQSDGGKSERNSSGGRHHKAGGGRQFNRTDKKRINNRPSRPKPQGKGQR